MIEPRTLKGFRDHLPAQALARERLRRQVITKPLQRPRLNHKKGDSQQI